MTSITRKGSSPKYFQNLRKRSTHFKEQDRKIYTEFIKQNPHDLSIYALKKSSQNIDKGKLGSIILEAFISLWE